MRVTFVYPRFEKFLASLPELDRGLVDYFLGNFTTPLARHSHPGRADAAGGRSRVAWTITAGQPVDYDAPTDLVAINSFTPQATRAFEIADSFRAHGKKVIMGGLFPSFMAEDVSNTRTR